MAVKNKQVGYKNLNLRTLFQSIGQKIIKDMQTGIVGKVGIDGIGAEPNAPATVRRKGKDHRMIDTGSFYRSAYESKPQKQSLTITIKDKNHPSGETYLNIAKWNQKNHPEQNRKIKASLHFGAKETRLSEAYDLLLKEVYKQLGGSLRYKATIEKVF